MPEQKETRGTIYRLIRDRELYPPLATSRGRPGLGCGFCRKGMATLSSRAIDSIPLEYKARQTRRLDILLRCVAIRGIGHTIKVESEQMRMESRR